MNKLPLPKRVQILNCLVEGCSLRSTSRMAGVSINTVTKLLVDAGRACAWYQDEKLRNLPCTRFQLDEIWSFVGCKEKSVPEESKGQGRGDVWTWTAIDDETKLIPCWLVGLRDLESATEFVNDLAERVTGRIQITTDGLKAYVKAIDGAFGDEVDYAVLHKVYGMTTDMGRYSPPHCIGIEKKPVVGNPEERHVSTSYVERQNLTMRMRMRRFTRLTNAFSKKFENHGHAVALHFMHYNFIRRHASISCTPAMKAKVTDRVWSMEDLVAIIDQFEDMMKRKMFVK